VATCEKDIENLETESENLRKDNLVLIQKVGTLESANKDLKAKLEDSETNLEGVRGQLQERDDRIKELEQRLEEADEKADGTPVKYASARKALTKAKLAQLRKALQAAPAGAAGFGGSCSVYNKKTKRVSLVEFKSKADALDVLSQAEKGHVDIIM
jgi:chromosome segregation ATPase